MMNVILPVFLFGILVFIHELGHFSVAKWSGVFVERFALGFGPAILRKKWGETEYAICLLPLGGYVKMRGEGEDDEATPAASAVPDPRSFASKPVWTRIAIVAMGPISNLILPIALFSGLFMVGMDVPTPHVGSVVPGYPAANAGVRPGDRIVKVAGEPVATWNQLTDKLGRRAGQATPLEIERDGQALTLSVLPVAEEGVNAYGEKQEAGKIGIEPVPYLPAIGVVSADTPAARAGLRTGDVITAIDGQPVKFWWQVDAAFARPAAKGRILDVRRLEGEKETATSATLPGSSTLATSGLEEGSQYVREVKPDSIAAEKGILPGDKIVALDGKPVVDWYDFRKRIQASAGASLDLTLRRGGREVRVAVTPQEVTHKDEITQEKRKHRQLGVISAAMAGQPFVKTERYANPVKAVYRGVEETFDIAWTTLVGMGKLVAGKLSMQSLGGPISIFYLAGTSYKMGGWEAFFRMMAILSITLAVLNFLPIPVLDGGHLFFFLIEAAKGSPVSLKIQKIGQQVGLAMVLSLMVLTFYVDVNRFFVDRIKSFFQ